MEERFQHIRVTSHPAPKDPEKVIRVGYVSPDVASIHAVAFFCDHVISAHDRQRFYVVVYLNADHQPLAGCAADKFVNIAKMETASVASLIQSDQIDILVDLAGHSAHNRLDVFACTPAPVQVTWVGYPNTTGLKTIKYRVTDALVDAPQTSQRFTEQLWRLPHSFLCFPTSRFLRDPETPPLSDPPSLSNGHTTFGSFNTLAKVQGRCFDLWVRLLQEIPDARLCLKAGVSFSSSAVADEWYARFEAKGIARDRVTLLPKMMFRAGETNSHLATYAQVDIALDTFPYAGTTTTVEAALMGVPVITLQAPHEAPLHASNVGRGLNTTLGLEDLVADSESKFVDIARQLAGDRERLVSLRRSLRDRVGKSALGDEDAYHKQVDDMFRQMWTRYCQGDE